MNQVYKYFATTVALITSHWEGRDNVMSCEWTMCIGWDPLKVLVVIHRDQLTHQYISHSGEFGVNLCSDAMAAQSNLAGSLSGRDKDKLGDPLFCDRLCRAHHISAPMIEGCMLNAECAVESTFELDEYTGFKGVALIAASHPEVSPLFYHQGKYFRLGHPVEKEC